MQHLQVVLRQGDPGLEFDLQLAQHDGHPKRRNLRRASDLFWFRFFGES